MTSSSQIPCVMDITLVLCLSSKQSCMDLQQQTVPFPFPLWTPRDQQAIKTTHFYSRHKSDCQSDLRMGLLLRKRLPERCSHSTPWPKPATPSEDLDKDQSINHKTSSKQACGSTAFQWHYSCSPIPILQCWQPKVKATYQHSAVFL